MKLKRKNTTKKRFIINLIVLFLYITCMVAYFWWGIEYIHLWLAEKPNTEHQQLASQIESAREELARMPNLVGEREQQLVHAQELLISEQNKMPSELNINYLIGTIIEVAELCQVKAIPLKTTSPESQIINKYCYCHWRISMSVEGEFQDVVNFIDNLDGKDVPTATVVSVALQRGEENPNSSVIQNDTAPVSGTLELVVYTRSQDYKGGSQ